MSQVTMRTLAPGLVELGGVFVRHGESDAELARVGFTYIVRGGPGEWKIVVAVAHDVDTAAAPLSPG